MIALLETLATAVALIWIALVVRFVMGRRNFRPARPLPWPDDAPRPTVEIVVPAHNEEADVETTVRSLLSLDFPVTSITVVDDQSTDATGVILDRLAVENPRLKVVHGIDRPAGWVGKTWALRQGVEDSASDWLLFVDADMRLHPASLSTGLVEAERAGADLVSFLPRADCRGIWQISVALALGQVLAQLYPLGAVNDPNRPEALAAGGFILVRRTVYLAAGGHDAVRSEIVDDIRLAGRIKSSGGQILTLPASALAETHMYGDLRRIIMGLRKNAFAGMEYQLRRFLVGAVVAILMAWTPWASITAGTALKSTPLIVAGGVGAAAQACSYLPLTIFLGVNPLWVLSAPIGITVYVLIAALSVSDYLSGRILWKGRNLRTTDLLAAAPGSAEEAGPKEV